jgi:anti-sigma-K factor RskA
MKYQDARLRSMLAAEYVLGTLRGRARQRFERLLRSDASLNKDVAYWERRFAALLTGIKPVPPRDIVWAEIDAVINASKVARLPPPRNRALPLGSLGFWRNWAAAASVASIALGYGLWLEMSQPPQVIERLQTVRVEVPVLQPMPYVAMLQPAAPAQWMVMVMPDRRTMKVASSGAYPMDAGKHGLQLWCLDDAGQPHSMGMVPANGVVELPMPDDMTSMPQKPVMAVSLEPKGGSPTGLPTGPVVTTAPLLQL